jgi:hypothetical protein
MPLFKRFALPFWSVLIAIVLWLQVHGQGMGSLRMDVALQVRDVPVDMVIVNDLPDEVSITVSGLQTQLNALDAKNLFVTVDASGLNLPGVVEQALDVEAIDLPVGLKVEKIQPDSVQLQVDHVVKRTIEITPVFDLPQGWKAEHVLITPATADLSGPEVWLSTLNKIETTALRLDLAQGVFDVETELAPLSGKGIHLANKDLKIRVRGQLVWTPTVKKPAPEVNTDESSDDYGKVIVPQQQISIVPKPVPEEVVSQEVVPQENVSEATTSAEQTQVVERAAVKDKNSVLPESSEATSVVPAPEETLPEEMYSQPQEKAVPVGDL